MKQWIGGGKPPEAVAEFAFDPSLLRQVTPRQRAIYRAIIALMLRHGARDFHTAERITASLVLEKKIDDHHVFPQGFLSEKYSEISTVARDCVLNRTLIDKVTNIRIGKRAPSDYLEEIRQAVGSDQLTAICSSHLLPVGSESPLWSDHFELFLAERQALIVAQLQAVTQ